ncbi:NACHT domain-containing protein [Acinetobacter courvalinii]|uniref:NACHT domain-containing protein n=1 Tax=Acinetobacter courvalinii TaxID=280147 RepID=A0AA42IBT1_9GAMM|nr:NACHT domain-containing protein [Acinetobacter courvalinii]MDH0565137.1 NACHT domain-containing protein [Acinetobacter courvalinii]
MQEELIKTFVSELITQFTLPIFNGLKKLTKETSNKIQVSFNLCFSEYLERNYERYSKTKTLLYREMPVNIKDFYVRTDLLINSKIINEHNFIEEIEVNKRLIILGSAGSGKSTFCKSLFIELIEKPIGVFPIFIELRHLNSSPDKSIYNFILNTMVSINPSFNKEQLDYAFKLGKVLIVLDGFDEVNSEEREKIEMEILHLSNNYHGIRMLISSRFDNSFSTNPLLLTMMLLTYEQIAEIPNKIHLFYEQAFLTLFNKHDSLKSMYKRKSFSQLPLDDFKRCLEAFCILSYCDRSYSFGASEINKFLDNSIAISASKTTANDF